MKTTHKRRIPLVMTVVEPRCPNCEGSAINLHGLQLAEVEESLLDGDTNYAETTLSGEWVGQVEASCEDCGHTWTTSPTRPLYLDGAPESTGFKPEDRLTVARFHGLLTELRRWAQYMGGFEAPVWDEVEELFDLVQDHRLDRREIVVEVSGGMVTAVEGLPPDWRCVVYDHDAEAVGEEPKSFWTTED